MFKRWWWVFLVTAFLGPVIGLGVAAVVTYAMPRQYESRAVVQVKPRVPPMTVFGRSPGELSAEGSMTPRFFAAEFEAIKSRDVLIKVIQRLDLQTKWGQDQGTIIGILRGIVDTQNIRGTDLIAIKVRHTNAEDTRDIAVEVAKVYKEFRNETEGKGEDRKLEELKKAVREQEDKVEEKRKLLGRIKTGPDSVDYVEAKKENETAQDMLGHTRLKQQVEQIQKQIQTDSIMVHEEPVVPRYAVRPNVRLNLVLGVIVGFLFSPLMALPVVVLLHRRVPAACPVPAVQHPFFS